MQQLCWISLNILDWVTYNSASDNSASQDFWANFAYFLPNFDRKLRNVAKNWQNLG